MANLEEVMEISGSSHHQAAQPAAEPAVVSAQVKMSAGEIVKLLPSLSPALSHKLLHFLQQVCDAEGRVHVTKRTRSNHGSSVRKVESVLEQVCEGFGAELEALLGSSSSVGTGGAVEQGGALHGDIILQQLSFCLLLALAPSLPNASEIYFAEFGDSKRPPTYSSEQAVEVLYSALVSQHWSNGVRGLRIDGEEAFGTDRACEHLAHLLKSAHCKLQLLYMWRIPTLDAGGMRHIARALHTNTSLTKLVIYNCAQLGDGGVEQLAAVLRTNSTLQELNLIRIGMTAQGLGHLCDALQSTRQSGLTSSSASGSMNIMQMGGLKKLDISENLLGEGGAALLGAMLANNRCLRRLSVKRCFLVEKDIDGEGHFAKGLRENSTLQELDISYNQQLGKVALVRSLATNNTSLKTLNMIDMDMPAAAEELAHMIISNHSIVHLSLVEATYSANEWATVILPALGRNTTLQSINLEWCPGVEGDQVLAALFDLLRINTTIQHIHLSRTPLDKAGKAEAVKKELGRNKEFRQALSALPTAKPKSCRIVLCGHAYAGKSTLFETMKLIALREDPQAMTPSWSRWMGRLLFDRFSHNYNNLRDKELSKRTRGIEIHLLKDEPSLRISVWDMAGQREFHALHDIMFPSGNSSATLFVLTFSPIVSPADELRAGQLKTNRELEDEVQYWLRFIASNSKPSAPSPTVVVVITHKDTLLKLGTHVESWLRGAQDIIARLAVKFSGRVEVQPQPFMVDALASQDIELKRWVKEVEKSLRSTLDGLQEEPAICNQVLKAVQDVSQTTSKSPIISKAEFKNICRSHLRIMEVEMARAKERRKGELEFSKAVEDRIGTAVGAYLHDAGEVIHHDKLDLIVSNPRWFCHGVLGQLIDLFPSSKKLETPKNGLVSSDYLSNLLQEAVKSVPGLDPTVVTPDQLIKLMLILDLCYEQTPGDPNTAYFLPALFHDEGNRAANGKRPLAWRKLKTSTFVGRRLQCGDMERTFLTDGFFPRLQVVLHNHAFEMKWVENWYSGTYKLEKNLFNIWVNGMEIFIEFSGSSGYFVDILVKSSKSHEATMEFLRPNIIGTIRTFCACQEGCQGVTLVEAIVRPECLYGADGGNPILCTYRRDQSILVEELTRKMKLMPNYEHCWDKVEDGAGGLVLHEGQDSGTLLLQEARPEPNYNRPWVEGVCYPDNNWKQGKSRGLALIVSMEKERPGAGVDRGRLETLFHACGFTKVQHHVDLTASELIVKMNSVAEEGILEEDECFVCSINAHGGTSKDGKPYIMDENKEVVMVIQDIIEPFRHSKHLLGKPKIFFVNCCRVNSNNVEADDFDQQAIVSQFRPLPELSDCLLVFSTSEGCPSGRHDDTGTIFVENLVQTVMTERHTRHVLDMMTSVNNRVAEVQNEVDVSGTTIIFRQCCEIRHSFRKDLYWKDP